MAKSKLVVTETFRSENTRARQELLQKSVDRYLRAALSAWVR